MPLHKDLTGPDLHDPKAHATSHQNGGSDEISVAGLSGALADPQPTTIAQITDATAAGQALLDDLDAAAQRTTLGLGTVATLASDTDTTLAANSDTRVATQKAVKAYVDAAGGGGGGTSGYVMQEEQVASASASLVFAAFPDAAYETFVLELLDMITSAATELGVQVSTDGGSTWVASTDYEFWGTYSYSGGTAGLGHAGTSRISLRQGAATTLLTNCGYGATLKFFNLPGGKHKLFTMHSAIPDSSVGFINLISAGRIKTTSAITAIRVIPDSGTITSGTGRVYGIAKA